MEAWEEKLLGRAREIVQHGSGRMEVLVAELKDKTKIVIRAGQSWKYLVDKKSLDKL